MGYPDSANSGSQAALIQRSSQGGYHIPGPGEYGYIPGAAEAMPMPGGEVAANALGAAEGGIGLLKFGSKLLAKIGSWFGKKAAQVGDAAAGAANAVKPGEFSISNWSGYPAAVAKPAGPFRLLGGAEYEAARDSANAANRALRKDLELVGQKVDIHEIQPVKFNGSPTDPANKVILDRNLHRQQVTPWWNVLQRTLEATKVVMIFLH